MIGSLVGLVVSLWLNLGSYTKKTHAKILPTTISGCVADNVNQTFNNQTNFYTEMATTLATNVSNINSTIFSNVPSEK